MAATLKIPTIFTAVDKMSSVVRTMSKSVKGFSAKAIASVKRFDQKLTGTFKKLGKFSQLAIGVGVGALFREAIQGNIAFNDSLASVSAITGATGQDLIDLENLAKNTAKVHKKAGSEVLKAYELVGSAKPELLSNVNALDSVTQSVITLSKASRLDLETSALSLTGVMNQFNLAADKSGEAIDVLAAGAKYGAAAIPDITEAILKFGTGAKAFNVDMAESVALVEVFAAKGIKGAESGTKLRNIMSKMSAIGALPPEAIKQLEKFGVNTDIVSDATLPFSQRLKELSKIAGDSTALVKVFGLENKEAAQILLNNIPMYEELNKNVRETGVAQTQAATNTNTLKFALESIKTSFINATTATNGNSKALDIVKKALFFVGDNMETVVAIIGTLLAAYAAMKVVTGIMQAITIATQIWTAVQWLLNAAMMANPIGLIILAIIALIAIVVGVIAVIKNWGSITDWFSQKWTQFTDWISKAWDKVVGFFKEFNFKEFFKKIGQSILTFLLMPMKGLLTLLSKIPGKIGKMASLGLEKIGEVTGNISVGNGTNDNAESLDSPEVASGKMVSETIKKSNVNIDIRDKGNNVEKVTSDGNLDIPVKVTPTQGVN